MFSLIAAIAHDGAIGQGHALPWGRIPADLRWFRSITVSGNPLAMASALIHGVPYPPDAEPVTGNALICGHTTYRSLPHSLQGRHTVVLSRAQSCPLAVHHAHSLDDALAIAVHLGAPHTFVIGGAQVYAEALAHPACGRLYITEVWQDYPTADTWWPWDMTLWGWRIGLATAHDPLPWFERTHVSPWQEAADQPRIRFGIWKRVSA